MKVVCTVWTGGKAGDNIKCLPISIVYGIAITAMSFFTDPTISTLTSGSLSQNVDLAACSFPRRIGVRFHSDFMRQEKLAGCAAIWDSYEDKDFTKKMGKEFHHEGMVNREGWAKYCFEGIYPTDIAYVKLELKDTQSGLLRETFYFMFEKSYQKTFDGRHYVQNPILNERIVKNGILYELHPKTKAKRHSSFKRIIGKSTKRTPKIWQTSVNYCEKPKMIFFITPPHLLKYAKLSLIAIKQLVDLNFDQSYTTKENQKPLYKTRYMLDELGNLQSDGHGIAGFQTMLSIGLGQDQQFSATSCIMKSYAA